jgi:hypothetical protein
MPPAPRCFRYGTPQPFVSAFAPSRGGGEAAFGILEWGGCGYTNSDGGKGQVPLPKEAVGAYSDKNEDSAGGGPAAVTACGVDGLLLRRVLLALLLAGCCSFGVTGSLVLRAAR